MKKFWMIVMAGVLALSLGACGTAPTEATDDETINTDGETGADELEIVVVPAGELAEINGETELKITGVKFMGNQHPAKPDKKPSTENLDYQFNLDETISVSVETEYKDFASEKAKVVIVPHITEMEFVTTTAEMIYDIAVVNKALATPDENGVNFVAEVSSLDYEEGEYDVLFMMGDQVAYKVVIEMYSSLNAAPDESTDGDVVVDTTAAEEGENGGSNDEVFGGEEGIL